MNAEGRRISESCVRENRMHSLMKGEVKISLPYSTKNTTCYAGGSKELIALSM